MEKQINFSLGLELTKENFLMKGVDYFLAPIIDELVHSAKESFMKMVLENESSNQYQFVFTIKELVDDTRIFQ